MSEESISQLVVIGSSAGGVEALSKLVSTLPDDFPAPIVLAQHLDPERESHLREILSRRSTLPVRTVTDQAPLEAGVVFVVPANRHVNITDSEVGLQVDSAGRPKPSVDLLLSSAAEVYGERLIAVVLTGMGTDGADGARLVNEAGGTVVVQDPEDAAFPGMPGSLAPNVVDITADLANIGPLLGDLVSGVEVARGAPRSEAEEEALAQFLEEIRDRHGVDFRSYKTPTILRRLKRRLAATGSLDIEAYRGYLEEHPDEYRQLVSSFLIKVTEFFRDPELYEYLKEEVLPELVQQARENERQLRIWSAGCSTGEEAYSLAILLSEVLGEEAGLFDARIFATDIDEEAVSFARHGVYPESSLGGLSREQIERYFTEEDGQYQVKKAVRSMVVFGEHDLARRSPFPRIDLCVSRNVLIYFTPELQRRALQLFAYSLRDGGALVLGKAETPSPLSNYFAPASRQYKVYRRQGERFLMPTLPTVPTPMPKRPSTRRGAVPEEMLVPGADGSTAGTGPQQPETQQRVRTTDEGLLNQLPVGAVVVDRRYDIRAINTPARRLLSVHGVVVGEDFLHTLKEAPYVEVRSAIDAAFRDGGSASTSEFAAEETTGEQRYLRLDCYPQRAAGEPGLAETVMVVVNDVTRSAAERRDLEERLAAATADLARIRREAEADTARLEQQNARLVETNRNLEEAIHELTNLSEDLQEAYEGALLTAEESQAAVEEVETLNEELQATNEELETLNEELQATIEELNTTNDDLQARTAELQESTRGREEDRQQAEVTQQDLVRRAEEPEGILQGLLNDAVLVVDADGGLLFGNKAFERVFGEPEEAAASPSSFLYTGLLDEAGEGLPEDATPLSRATRGEIFTMRFAVEDGGAARRLYEAEGHPLNPEGIGGGAVVFREVSGEPPAEG